MRSLVGVLATLGMTLAFAVGEIPNSEVIGVACAQVGDCQCDVSIRYDSPQFSIPLCLGGKLTIKFDAPTENNTVTGAAIAVNTLGRQQKIQIRTDFSPSLSFSEISLKNSIEVEGTAGNAKNIPFGLIKLARTARTSLLIVNLGGSRECQEDTTQFHCVICVSRQGKQCLLKDQLGT